MGGSPEQVAGRLAASGLVGADGGLLALTRRVGRLALRGLAAGGRRGSVTRRDDAERGHAQHGESGQRASNSACHTA